MKIELWILLTFLLSVLFAVTSAQTWLRADATSDPYTLIDNILGINATLTIPDCKHKEKHIQMANDDELKRPVFLFHLHVDLDDDYCQASVRQRTEISVTDSAPNDTKGFNLETVSFSWNFKLDAKFQPSEAFTHIHQLNVRKNGLGYPMVVIVVNKDDPDILRVAHIDSSQKPVIIGEMPLAPFKGTWVHVQENATYSSTGNYSITMTKLSDGTNLLNATKIDLEMWRDGAAYVRPKWGIYRGLQMKNELRDEIVKFDSFCLGKGINVCQ